VRSGILLLYILLLQLVLFLVLVERPRPGTVVNRLISAGGRRRMVGPVRADCHSRR
jgi:hypothetical protein